MTDMEYAISLHKKNETLLQTGSAVKVSFLIAYSGGFPHVLTKYAACILIPANYSLLLILIYYEFKILSMTIKVIIVFPFCLICFEILNPFMSRNSGNYA